MNKYLNSIDPNDQIKLANFLANKFLGNYKHNDVFIRMFTKKNKGTDPQYSHLTGIDETYFEYCPEDTPNTNTHRFLIFSDYYAYTGRGHKDMLGEINNIQRILNVSEYYRENIVDYFSKIN